MVVRFTWRPQEWREAYLLATREEDRSAGVPMCYVVVGIMMLGGFGELANALGNHRDAMVHDSLVPALLLVSALVLSVGVTLSVVRRRERFRGQPNVPAGEQQVTLHELGWRAEGANGAEVRGWSDLRGLRTGRRVLTLLTCDGTTVAVPLRALTADQEGWLERLLLRKVPRLV